MALHDVLYYYTTQPGLLGIVKGKCLWAANLRYLNDSTEATFALGLLRSTIDHHGDHIDDKYLPYRGQHQHLARALRDVTVDPMRFDVYVFSLSEVGDLLSQWRAYCPHTGYAIGFRRESLINLGRKTGFSLVRCSYGLGDDWRTLVEQVHSEFRGMLERRPIDEAVKACQVRLVELLHERIPAVKHPAFSEEREWRLISGYRSVTLQNIQHRVTGSMLIPYTVLPFDGYERDLIAEIIVGPAPHEELSVVAARILAEKSGLKADQVRNSKVPYRTL